MLLLVPGLGGAQNLTATSAVPSTFFVDTNETYFGIDFVLECEGGAGVDTGHFCRWSDEENGNDLLAIASRPTSLSLNIGPVMPGWPLRIATPQAPALNLDSPFTDLWIGEDTDDDFMFFLLSPAFMGSILTLENELGSGLYPGLGVWNLSPVAPLHVRSHDGKSAALTVENKLLPQPGDVAMFRLINPGASTLRFVLQAGSSIWTFDNAPSVDQFRISKVGTGVAEFTVNGAGNGTFVGSSYAQAHVNTSSRASKTDFAPVDVQALLDQVAALPLQRWRYKGEAPEVVHVGPVAEDFQAAFSLGDGRHISTVDASGVALASIQALSQRNASLARQLPAVHERLSALESRLGPDGWVAPEKAPARRQE